MKSWVAILCWIPFKQQSILANTLWPKKWGYTVVSEQVNIPFSSIHSCPLKKAHFNLSGCSEIETYLTTAVIQQQDVVGKNFMLTSPGKIKKAAASKCRSLDQRRPFKIILKRRRNDQKPTKLQSRDDYRNSQK